ncbi:hypothetical protein [Micromonospora inositola]|uniref:Uncharacterized protein n=1 Tax=Micromonospora inositola TaxID=47865 RepID=A0A1C5JGT7_9ACTN|nr:hypothetical protein [Micromonospora inositola]SCG69804.1 hypothetical protein GA0070613_4668 [Micromonospora inositola]
MSQENRDRAMPARPAELSREDAGCIITARWHTNPGPSDLTGPDEVVIRVADDAAPEIRESGVTSAVLHRIGRQVDDMVAEFHELPSVGGYQVMVRRYLEGRLAELAQARGAKAEGFESDLLAAFQDVAGRGHGDPLAALASATGRSREALDHLLEVARQRNDHDGHPA